MCQSTNRAANGSEGITSPRGWQPCPITWLSRTCKAFFASVFSQEETAVGEHWEWQTYRLAKSTHPAPLRFCDDAGSEVSRAFVGAGLKRTSISPTMTTDFPDYGEIRPAWYQRSDGQYVAVRAAANRTRAWT